MCNFSPARNLSRLRVRKKGGGPGPPGDRESREGTRHHHVGPPSQATPSVLAWAFPPPHRRALALLGILAVELLVLFVREDFNGNVSARGDLVGESGGCVSDSKGCFGRAVSHHAGRPPDKTLITSGSRVRDSSAWTGGFWSSSASAC